MLTVQRCNIFGNSRAFSRQESGKGILAVLIILDKAGRVFVFKILVDIRNGIGDVKLFLHNVKMATFNLISKLGQEINRFKPCILNGNDLEVKIKSKYGDIEVF